MEPSLSCAPGFFVTTLLFQMVLTSALGLDIQINVQVSETKVFLVECNSGGWLPYPQMEWRDSRGNVIPASSNISQDAAGLWHLKTSVLLENHTHGPITCCFFNPVTRREKRASIVLPDILLKLECMSTQINVWLVIYFFTVFSLLCLRPKVFQDSCPILFKITFECLPFLIHISTFPLYWHLWHRVSILDALAPLYSTWMCDLSTIMSTLMLFFTTLIFLLLHSLEGCIKWTSDYSCETQDT